MSYSGKIITVVGSSEEYLDTPITLTNDWVTIGSRIGTIGLTSIGVWLDVVINDSTEILIRPVCYPSERSDNGYSVPTMEIYTGINHVYPKQYLLEEASDQKLTFQITTAKIIPYVEIQVKAGTVGVTPATINSLILTSTGDR